MVEIRLGYDRGACSKCGDTSRVLGVPCGTCGAPPGAAEVNVQVQRRRRFSGRVRAVLMEGPPPEEVYAISYGVLGAMFRRVGDDLTDLLATLSRASHATTAFADAEEVAAAARRVSATSVALEHLGRERPARSTVDHLRRLSAQNRAILMAYLDALDARTPLEAQGLAVAAQTRIDESSARLDDLNRIRDAAAVLEEDSEPQTALERLFGALAVLYPGRRITQLEALGRVRFEELTGLPGASGTGVGTLGMDLVAKAHLDPSRFVDVLAHLAKLLAADPPPAQAVFADHQVRLGIRRALDLSLEAYAQIALLFPRVGSDDAALRQVLKLYKNMFEDVMAPLAAALLAATGAAAKPYGRLIQEDAAELARRVDAASALDSVLEGVVSGYRNAESHGAHSYSLEGSEVVFSLRTFAERVPVEVLLNDCFALIESVMAIQLAMSNQLALLGYVDHQPDDLGMFQPSPRQLAELLLKDQGIAVIALEDEGDQWTVTVRDQPPPVTAIAGGLETVAPPPVHRFLIRNEVQGRVTVIEIDRGALREALDCDGDAAWATVVALAGTTRDGERALTGRSLRRAVAAIGVAALGRRNIDRIPRLRRLRALALAQGDQEAADLAVAAMRAIRLGGEAETARRPEWQAWIGDGDLTML